MGVLAAGAVSMGVMAAGPSSMGMTHEGHGMDHSEMDHSEPKP